MNTQTRVFNKSLAQTGGNCHWSEEWKDSYPVEWTTKDNGETFKKHKAITCWAQMCANLCRIQGKTRVIISREKRLSILPFWTMEISFCELVVPSLCKWFRGITPVALKQGVNSLNYVFSGCLYLQCDKQKVEKKVNGNLLKPFMRKRSIIQPF